MSAIIFFIYYIFQTENKLLRVNQDYIKLDS